MAETKVTRNEIEAQEAWNTPTLVNSWVNFGNGFDVAGYMKDSLGFVHLKGMVKNGAVGSVIFTLPVGYRPLGTLYMASVANSPTTPGIINVSPTGTITVDQGNTGYMSLSSIVFRAEQ